MREFFLSAERLGFSLWAERDLPLAEALWGDPQVARYITAGGRFSPEEIAARLAQERETHRRCGVQYWLVFRKEDGVFAGCCGLRPFDAERAVYELGFHLLPAFWGKGYATEAAGAVIGLAADRLAASALFAGHHPDNAASAAVLRKLGFARTGEQLYPPTGRMHPSYLLDLAPHRRA